MNSDISAIFVQVTAGSAEEAWTIARALVERKLAACAQVFPIRSCYEWQGEIQEDNEAMIFVKSRLDLYAELEAYVKELHSYDVPEILALPVVAGSEAYLRWIDEVVGRGS
jgi:periplasmic divalent cation tolerance protein